MRTHPPLAAHGKCRRLKPFARSGASVAPLDRTKSPSCAAPSFSHTLHRWRVPADRRGGGDSECVPISSNVTCYSPRTLHLTHRSDSSLGRVRTLQCAVLRRMTCCESRVDQRREMPSVARLCAARATALARLVDIGARFPTTAAALMTSSPDRLRHRESREVIGCL